jgi:hypothetical protein
MALGVNVFLLWGAQYSLKTQSYATLAAAGFLLLTKGLPLIPAGLRALTGVAQQAILLGTSSIAVTRVKDGVVLPASSPIPWTSVGTSAVEPKTGAFTLRARADGSLLLQVSGFPEQVEMCRLVAERLSSASEPERAPSQAQSPLASDPRRMEGGRIEGARDL